MKSPFAIGVALLLAQTTGTVRAQARYDNPVDKKTYMTNGEFKTYSPKVPKDTRGQRVVNEGIMLLTGEDDLKQRISVEALSAFIKAVETKAFIDLAGNKLAMRALVQFKCQPSKCEVQMASQGQADEAVLQRLYDTLTRLPPLRTTGEVIFQVEFRVKASPS